MSPDAVAGLVALGGGAVVLSTQRALSPAVPAVAAPIAVAWPHGAPALGVGVALGGLVLGGPRRLPGPAYLAALALAVTIAIAGDGGLVRGAAAAAAVAVAVPAYVRTLEDNSSRRPGTGTSASCGRSSTPGLPNSRTGSTSGASTSRPSSPLPRTVFSARPSTARSWTCSARS